MSTTTASHTTTALRRRRTGCAVVAAEHGAAYHTAAAPAPAPASASSSVAADGTDAAPASASASASGSVAADGTVAAVPFGLPVLAELPELAAVLGELHTADRAMSKAVVGVADLLATDEVTATSGVSVEQWIAIVTRHTRMDRRLLLRAARLLGRFPTLRSGVVAGHISWPQLRGLTLALRRAPTLLDERLDDLIGRLLVQLQDAEPDVLVRQVEQAIIEWRCELEVPDEPPVRPFLQLQPRLDGSGGRCVGELDAAGLAILDDATAPRREQLDHPGGVGGARLDNLLTRLLHACDPPTTGDSGDPHGDHDHGGGPHGDHDHGGGPHGGDVHGGGPDGSGLVGDGGCGPGDAGAPSVDGSGGADPAGAGAGVGGGVPALPPVRLLLRWDLEALLDRSRTPAVLLTRLLGGSLRLSSPAARRLLDARGAELRSIVFDAGEVVGVGRATRIPPGWLSDAVLAVHESCSGPLCERPARGSELDHARPWWPTRPDEVGGNTDVANLGPLCAATNRDKERAGWRVEQGRDGRRTWTHARSGLRITTVPSTWRPPPDAARPREPCGTDPPG